MKYQKKNPGQVQHIYSEQNNFPRLKIFIKKKARTSRIFVYVGFGALALKGLNKGSELATIVIMKYIQ
jgi:hypothetical protein